MTGGPASDGRYTMIDQPPTSRRVRDLGPPCEHCGFTSDACSKVREYQTQPCCQECDHKDEM